MYRKEIKRLLQTSCSGVLRELLEEVGFSKEEQFVFYNRYVLTDPHSVPVICLLMPCSASKYNDIHNRILDKVSSHLEHKK